MAIREVSLVLGYHAAGSAADNGKTSIFEGPTETAIFCGDMSQTGLQYKSAVLAPAAGIWNQVTLTASLPGWATRQTQPQTRIGTRSGSKLRSPERDTGTARVVASGVWVDAVRVIN
jgi:hypothetical protein